MRRVILLVTLALFASTLFVGDSRTAEPNQVGDFMKMKLEHSKKVLEGLTMEDFSKITKSARDLSLLSQEASWQVLQTEEYIHQSTEFRRTADALHKAGKDKNLDGAALAYMELTMKCINCHKYVRNVRMAQAEDDPRTGLGR